MTETLYTRRNVPECLGMAWTLMITNIKRMAKELWAPALISAVVSTCILIVWIQPAADESSVAARVIKPAVSILLSLCAAVYLNAKVYKLLNMQSVGFCLRRAANVMLITLVLTLIASVIGSALAAANFLLASAGKLPATTCLVVFLIEILAVLTAVLLFFSPVAYTIVKYMTEPAASLKCVWRSYRTGLKSAGFIISLFLLCAVISIIADAIIALPGVIAAAAAITSNQGAAAGDAAGLPGYFPVLFAVTVFVTSFVATVLQIWNIFAAYYMYASIEARNGRTS